jgi:epoxyqueuosine reductase
VKDRSAEIATYVKELDLDLFGVGDLSLYNQELLGLDESIRKNYRFAVSIGLVLSQGLVDTLRQGPNQLYLHHYRQLNYRLDMAAYLLAREIERQGYRAIPFAASQLVDWQNQRAHISHKKVAEIAGLGWIGRNNLLVHPEFGSRVRLNTVLTDMPLPTGKPLDSGCGDCRNCLDRCPAAAIMEEPSMFDHQGCFNMLKKFRTERNLGHHICGICIEACKGVQ